MMLEQSGAQTQRGLFFLFIRHFFPGPQSTFSHVSRSWKEAGIQTKARRLAGQTGVGWGGGLKCPCAIMHPRWRAPGCLPGRLEGMGVGNLRPGPVSKFSQKTTRVGRFHYNTELRSLGGPTSSDLVLPYSASWISPS